MQVFDANTFVSLAIFKKRIQQTHHRHPEMERQTCTAVIIKMIQTMTMNAKLPTMANDDLSSILTKLQKQNKFRN